MTKLNSSNEKSLIKKCLTFDFTQNILVAHISTNPIFYAHQQLYYVFYIYNVGTIFTYRADIIKKDYNNNTQSTRFYVTLLAMKWKYYAPF